MTDSENNEVFLARHLIENTGVNVFLTGRAGTGKTTFLHELRQSTAKSMIVLAPTGIAAINAGGMTIHSFFQLSFSPFVPGKGQAGTKKKYDRFGKEKTRLVRAIDLLVIDEISMVRADLLDAVDASLRRQRDPSQPFGGVQLLLIGDLAQLAPVVKPDEWALLSGYYDTPYFFSSLALKQAGYRMVELTHVYRQRDEHFLDLLNRVRANTADAAVLGQLNQRYIPGFNPEDKQGYVRLTTHNERARAINRERLAALPGPEVIYEAIISGEFPDASYPGEPTLSLKPGARVMFLRNDTVAGYFNGMLGTVISAEKQFVRVSPDNAPDEVIDVQPVTWENTRYAIDPDSGDIVENVAGSFTQFPLRTAWAITIHKSQGLTFDKAVIDVSQSFAPGQTYVALSRCRTLEGLVLERPLTHSSIIGDVGVASFINTHRAIPLTRSDVSDMTSQYRLAILDKLFGFDDLSRQFDRLKRAVDEYLSKAFPGLVKDYEKLRIILTDQIQNVAVRYAGVYHNSSDESACGTERISGACRYFFAHTEDFLKLLANTPRETDRKTGTQRLNEALDIFEDSLRVKRTLLEYFSENAFDVKAYLEVSRRAVCDLGNPEAVNRKRKVSGAAAHIPDEVLNPALFKRLVEWRRQTAERLKCPAYTILSNKSIIDISNNMPMTTKELLRMHGIGKIKALEYGEQILSLVLNED